MRAVEEALTAAQRKAAKLLAEVIAVLESELSTEIHELANKRFGLRRHGHKRVVRCVVSRRRVQSGCAPFGSAQHIGANRPRIAAPLCH